jgi:hypothetical protein
MQNFKINVLALWNEIASVNTFILCHNWDIDIVSSPPPPHPTPIFAM